MASDDKVFKCKHCSKRYATQSELGGHASKQHKGQSEAYQQKMEKRKSREIERFALSVAQKLLLDMTDLPKERRVKVQNKVKCEILRLREGQLPSDIRVENLTPDWIERIYADLVNPECRRGLNRKIFGCDTVAIPQPDKSVVVIQPQKSVVILLSEKSF